MSSNRIAIVVPSLGEREEWLNTALASLVSQELRPRVILVGPEVHTLLRAAKRFATDFVVERGRGLSRAINQGVEVALANSETEYVSWLGDDDILAPGSLVATSATLDGTRSAPFAFGRLRYTNSAGEPLWLVRPGAWAVEYAKWGRNFVSQPGSLVRADAWRVAGGLDEELRNSMDQDLFLRLARLGHPAYVPRELAAFRVHDSSISSVKGLSDESRDVGRRYRPRVPACMTPLVSLAVKASDRVLLSVHRRVPGPSAPVVEGAHYTVSRK